MARIRKLTPELINQIAAGEVVERPASVVKELCENALDAGARRILVEIEDGGKRRIRVCDDGHGIGPDELPLAVASHATSKLQVVDDLFRITTLGFRGEALASIGSVAELRVGSAARGKDGEIGPGHVIEVRGGDIGPVRPAAARPGAEIDVRNLFFNTPARRKFLKAAGGETRQCAQVLTRLALGAGGVAFSLTADGREVLRVAPAVDPLERIADLFGRELADDLVWVERERGPLRLTGYIGLPRRTHRDSTRQLVSLAVRGVVGAAGLADAGPTDAGRTEAGRPIRDRTVQAALKEAYRGFLMTRRFPVAFLTLTLPGDLVDVNVHPQKLEVRFRDRNAVFGLLVRAVREALDRSPAVPDLRPSGFAAGSGAGSDTSVPTGRADPAGWVGSAAGRLSDWSSIPVAPEAALEGAGRSPGGPPSPPGVAAGPSPCGGGDQETARPPDLGEGGRASHLVGVGAPRAFLLRSGYLVVDGADGFELVDPHALHERILYEKVRRRLAAGAVSRQRLLVPVVVDLAPAERGLLEAGREALSRLGLEVCPFGPGTVAIQAVPALLVAGTAREPDWSRLLLDLLSRLGEGRLPVFGELVDSLAATMACKAAVKLGEALTGDAIRALLEERSLAKRSHLCPHGRPTSLRFRAEDLARQFHRK